MPAAEYDETTSLLFIDGKYNPVRVDEVSGVMFFDVETALALLGYNADGWHKVSVNEWIVTLARI